VYGLKWNSEVLLYVGDTNMLKIDIIKLPPKSTSKVMVRQPPRPV